ncbi:unnamed protein product [Adineta ricciae]|uniref:Uncharacterized protein n=1 Tax=Adineta ricciae TaxID=249248 RepID=A0A813MXK6_ADIRI|nr:unnamed protein product [Adineta ricciae]CAF1360315.1 unnamed protein product [Adineta ricciae]
MIGRLRRRICGRRPFFFINCCTIAGLLIILSINRVFIVNKSPPRKLSKDTGNTKRADNRVCNDSSCRPIYSYDDFLQWNRSLCSDRSDQRGPHQKVIVLSIYGSTSKYTDNPMFTWNASIIPFLEPLVNEVKQLLPTWIIRIYTDFVGSTQAQRDHLLSFDNIDVCDVNNLPMFGTKVLTYLPGKMWRFLPVFDPLVDFCLSRDLDSPITPRETETLDLWVSDEYINYIFHILRDHKEHGIPILGGLWGAAIGRARQRFYKIFLPLLVPSTAKKYNGTGDQRFLTDFVWKKVKNKSLAFDSYSCRQFGARPFPSKRPPGICFVGCIRECCNNSTDYDRKFLPSICPVACRPKDHKDWEYC